MKIVCIHYEIFKSWINYSNLLLVGPFYIGAAKYKTIKACFVSHLLWYVVV